MIEDSEYKNKNEYAEKFEEGRMLSEKLEEFYRKSERNKLKRMLYVICFYALVNTVILYKIFDSSITIESIIPIAIISVITAVVSYWINFSIFLKCFTKADEETKRIEKMKEELIEISSELNLKPKYELEKFLSNKHM